ncbi:MAG: glycosyltransferase family 2 protein [FCB group bacterium]|jgi:4,4'-diaponeurosporenoate glycosyltransferase|nr:glycosyltransferase family 2 protein [FCB group bacterium]
MAAAAALALWLLGFAVLFRVPVCRARRRAASLRMSIVVPARNEERNLPVLLASLVGQQPAPLEVIVVDDESDDRTADVAREWGATIVASKPQPPGWRGKNWACQQGAEAATGDVLVFVDADTFFEPGGLRRAADTFAETGGALSIGPYHRVQCFYEELSAVFNLIMTAGTGAFTFLGHRLEPRGLFGQFLMVERQTYFALGGHETVKARTLENYHLGARLRAAGVPVRCYGGRGTFGMRMYPDGLRSLVDGWTKSFASGATATPVSLLLPIVGWIAGAFLPVTFVAAAAFRADSGSMLVWACVYVLFALQTLSFLRRIGSFRVVTALAYPVPLIFFVLVFTRAAILSALGRRVLWKGRTTGPEQDAR